MPFRIVRLLLALLPGWLAAQSPTTSCQRLALQEGLPSNYATGLAQDALGFVWISTVNGLARFDGLHCQTFTRQSGNPRSLSHRVIRCVYRSRGGTLWVGTQEGLNRFEPRTQTFRRFPTTALGPGCNLVRQVAETRDGRLWLATGGGLVAYDPTTGRGALVPIPTDSLNRANVASVRRVLADGPTLWVGTQGGLFAYEWTAGRFRTFRHHAATTTSLPHDYVSALARHPLTGELFVGTHAGHLTALMPSTGRFRPLPLSAAGQEVSAVLFSKTGTLWAGVLGGGLHRFDEAQNRFRVFLNDENNLRSLVSNSVKNLFEDQAGVIWVVTDDAGVCWFNPTVTKLHSAFDDVGYHPPSTLGLSVTRLSVDRRQNLWVATRDGVVYLQPRAHRYRLYRHDPRNPHSLSDNHANCILADRRGRVWVGTASALNRLDPATGRVERIPCLPSPDAPALEPPFNPRRRDFVGGSQVFTLLEAPDGRILIGTNERLTVYDPRTDTYSTPFNDERLRRLPGKNYNHLYLDRHGNLWAGGLGSVYKIGPDLRLAGEFRRRDGDPHSLPDEGVTGFAEDRAGRLWLATDNGLARLDDQRTGRFSVFSTRHGLPHNDLAAVRAVGDTLWLSTARGLACLDTRTMRLTAFDESDGLPAAEFDSDAVAADSTGRVYFGNMRGLVYVQPHRMRFNRFVPPVYLSSLRVADRELLAGPLAQPPDLVLDHTQNAFTFQMAALSYDHPAGNRFAYRLEGFEETWTPTGNRPFAGYTSLPPGKYTLHVVAANNDGVWNRRGQRLRVVIQPPWWQTWWFRVTVLAVLAAAVVLVVRQRERRLLREEQEKSEARERIATSEMKALRAQMNPHFLYNSLNSIRLFVLQNDSDNADKYLVKFARLMRLILDNSRQEWITLASELEQLTLYLELEQLRFGDKFDFAVEADASLSPEKTTLPPMILQPYLENAILHGFAHKRSRGHLTLRVLLDGDSLRCEIDDDGVGRRRAAELKRESPTARAHRSVGLQVTQERLDLLSRRTGQPARVEVLDKVLPNGESAGTLVVVCLPLVYEKSPAH